MTRSRRCPARPDRRRGGSCGCRARGRGRWPATGSIPNPDWPPPRYPEIRPGEMQDRRAAAALAGDAGALAAAADLHRPAARRDPPGRVACRSCDRSWATAWPGGPGTPSRGSSRSAHSSPAGIDLTRAEAVLGVIEAANPAQLDAALHQLAGGLSGPILAPARPPARRGRPPRGEPRLHRGARRRSDRPGGPGRRSWKLRPHELAALARQLDERDRPEGHPRVVLVGPPNAGKSRLFNAMPGRDHAIVSPQAGTTRDYLTALCDCDGLTVELVDTAGIEEAGDEVGRLAQRHRQRAGRAGRPAARLLAGRRGVTGLPRTGATARRSGSGPGATRSAPSDSTGCPMPSCRRARRPAQASRH